ncbi:stalk domain-containing protein [Paenibacillus thiaminolyticus]|uniref:stalk domain-containing protein n=1 Tax=Paenibacillus thiaminolyticus TaxID=49283 RepID=UPI003D2CC2C3
MNRIEASDGRMPKRHPGVRVAVVLVLSGALLMQPAAGWGWGAPAVVEASGSVQSLKKLSEEIITSGAKLVTYQYTTVRNSKTYTTILNVIEADVKNPYIKLDVMTGQNGQTAVGQTVTRMTKETGAVAGVNGDFWMMSSDRVPMGASIDDGVLITSPAELKGMYAFAVKKDGTPTIDQYRFDGSIQLADGQTFPLSGINKMKYNKEPGGEHSHINALYIYTSAWKGTVRPNDTSTTPTEVLVRNGVVEQISESGALPIEVPEDGYILRGHGTAAQFMRNNLQVGESVEANYHLIAQSNGQSVDPSSFQMMISGHTLLVDNGKTVSFTRDTSGISGGSATARTAIGYSKDGRYAYLVTAQSNSVSSGLTLKEFQQALAEVGIWRAVNLDGGGSTTMANRPLGETETKLTFETKEGGNNIRSVVNGIGVYTTAPKGEVKGMTLAGDQTLFIGQQATFSLKGYDQYYNPVDASNADIKWSSSNDKLKWNGSAFTAMKSGTAEVTATSGGAKTTQKVQVIGADQVDDIRIAASSAPLVAGTKATLPVKVTLQDGSTATLPTSSVEWELRGFKGTVTDGVLQVDSVPEGGKIGYAIASYDGVRTMIPLTPGAEKKLEDFNAVNYPVSFSGLPKNATTGKVTVEGGFGGRSANDKVLKLSYDMTSGSGDKFAYAELNGSNGITLPGGTSGMKLDVYGDNSFNNLRMEIHDGSKAHYISVVESVNWEGWKTVEADLAALNLSSAAKLKRIYLYNPKEDQDERVPQGTVAIDNLIVKLPAGTDAVLNRPAMELTVGSKTAQLNGEKKQLDVAPLILNNVTYVPVRTIIDAFGGDTDWDAKTKRVTALRGNSMIDMTVGEKSFTQNGKRTKSDVAPIVRQSRTLVPLRLVSEQLGLSVKWDKKTKSITIR